MKGRKFFEKTGGSFFNVDWQTPWLFTPYSVSKQILPTSVQDGIHLRLSAFEYGQRNTRYRTSRRAITCDDHLFWCGHRTLRLLVRSRSDALAPWRLRADLWFVYFIGCDGAAVFEIPPNRDLPVFLFRGKGLVARWYLRIYHAFSDQHVVCVERVWVFWSGVVGFVFE